MVLVELLDPSCLGELLLQPRYYFLGIRSDLTLCNSIAAEVWRQRNLRCQLAKLVERLLAALHPFIAKHQAERKLRWQAARAQGFPDGMGVRWKEKHAQWEAQHSVEGVSNKTVCSANDLFLHLARERDAWTKLCQVVAEADQMVCDLSQSIDRARQPLSGKIPTITPGSHLVMGPVGRGLAPHETLLLHAFPLHQMTFPTDVSPQELSKMDGNTMHVQVVGVAVLLALVLTD